MRATSRTRRHSIWTAALALLTTLAANIALPAHAWQVVREAAPPEGAAEAEPAAASAAEPGKAQPVVEPADQAASTASNEKPADKAESKDEEASTTKKSTAATHTVAKGPFKVEVELEGVFEAAQTSEIALRPEAWSEFVVETAVEAGTRVEKGDVLLTLDPRNLDRAIHDMENDRELASLALKQAQDDLKHLEQESPLELDSAEQIARQSAQELKNWESVDRDYYVKSNDFSLRSIKQYVEYEEEELEQLEKMYAADDLTEETEEIILKRQREAVEQAHFYLERALIEHARTIEQEIPQRNERVTLQAKLAEILLARTKVSVPTELGRKRLELAKLRYEQSKADERLAKLQHDRGLMEIKAPEAGVVYYGRAVRGEWNGAASMAEQLRRGGNISAHQIVMTIVAPRPMFVRAKLPEKELAHVSAGQQGKAIPTGFPDMKLVAAIAQISPIPISEGQFDARVTVDLGNVNGALMPGMQCSIKLVPYRQDEAIAVPSKAVFTDELDDSRRYVHVVGDEGESTRRDVTVGKVSGDETEITAGLSVGEKLLLEKPDPGKSEET